MCEVYNITVKKTDAEDPFSNGLVERQIAVLEDMLLKTFEDENVSIEIALQWVINLKNSLTNVHGFSPYQLLFGFNSKLPNIDRPPALEEPNISKLLADNLNAMRSTRKAFVASERAEKLTRALRHNLRRKVSYMLLVIQCIIKEEAARNGKGQVKLSVLMANKY